MLVGCLLPSLWRRPLGCYRLYAASSSRQGSISCFYSTYRSTWDQSLQSSFNNETCISANTEDGFHLWNLGFSFTQRRGAKLAKPKDLINFWKIRVGDKVVVISGKDKGKVGEVLACDKLRNQVKVKNCNMRKLLVDGQMVLIEKKIHYSNVQLVDPLLSCGTRVSIRYNRDEEPLRVSKKSGYVIPWPEEKPEPEKDTVDGEKDTTPEVALARTYNYQRDLQSMQRLRQAMKKYNREL